MKFIYLILFAFGMTINAQQFEAFYDFDGSNWEVDFVHDLSENIWHIGEPNKTILNASNSLPNSIYTDTSDYYASNDVSSFEVVMEPKYGGTGCWGVGTMSFNHKYDFEPNKDGGYIEVSYDGSNTWTNMIFDTDPEIFIDFNNCYDSLDTIYDGTPAFTGNSNGWITSTIFWAWQMGVKTPYHQSMRIRFTSKSDGVQSNHEGWQIDDIHLSLYDCTSGIFSDENKIKVDIFPNPTSSNLNVSFPNDLGKEMQVKIFNSLGELVHYSITNKNFLDLSCEAWANGIYSFSLFREKEVVYRGKFLVAK